MAACNQHEVSCDLAKHRHDREADQHQGIMGIPGLLQLLKPVMTDVHVKRMAGKRVAIDAYVWLHKGTFSCALELAQGKHTDNYTRYCMRKASAPSPLLCRIRSFCGQRFDHELLLVHATD